jgi:hypothetical protein
MVGNNEVNRNFWAKRQVDQQVDQHVMSYPRDPCSHRHSTRMADDSCTRPPVGRADNLWPCRNTTAVVSRMSKTFSRNQRNRLVCIHPQTVLSTLLFRLDELPVFAVTRAYCLGRGARDPSSRLSVPALPALNILGRETVREVPNLSSAGRGALLETVGRLQRFRRSVLPGPWALRRR